MDGLASVQRDPQQEAQILAEWQRSVTRRKLFSRAILFLIVLYLLNAVYSCISAVGILPTINALQYSQDPTAAQAAQINVMLSTIITGVAVASIIVLASIRLLRFTLARLLFKRCLREVTDTLPNGVLKETLAVLIYQMEIPKRRLRIWIDMRASGHAP